MIRFRSVLLAATALLASACGHVEQRQEPPAPAPASAVENPTFAEEELGPYERQALDPTAPTVVGEDDLPPVRDPLERVNRGIFAFNDRAYRWVLSPVGRFYTENLPAPVQSGVTNFFANLYEPINSLNLLMQGRWADSGRALSRFGINTTAGVLGFKDAANDWFELEPARATFGDTLGHYGVGEGIYLVLPLLGPSDIKGVSTLAFDYLVHPAYYLTDRGTGGWIRLYDGFHGDAGTLAQYPDLAREAEDPYRFIRNLYWQRETRDALYETARD